MNSARSLTGPKTANVSANVSVDLPGNDRQAKIDQQMQIIMKMVSANSQLALIHGMFVNSVNN